MTQYVFKPMDSINHVAHHSSPNAAAALHVNCEISIVRWSGCGIVRSGGPAVALIGRQGQSQHSTI